MSFNSNIPLATDLISVSQGDLLHNFSSMQTTYNTDHFGFDPIANLGFHKKVTLPDQTSTPPTPAASQGDMFATTVNSETYPLWRRDGTTTNYQLLPVKAYALFTAANPPVSSFTLPYANITSITRISNSVYQITFSTAFPNTTYGGLATLQGTTNRLVTVNAVSTTVAQINVLNTDGSIPPDIGNLIMVAILY